MTDRESEPAHDGAVGRPAGSRGRRELLRTEDYWAIWLGLILIVAALLVYLPRPPAGLDADIAAANTALAREEAAAPLRTVAWYEALDAKSRLNALFGDGGGAVTAASPKTTDDARSRLDSLFSKK